MSTQQPLQLQPLQRIKTFAFHVLDKYETFWMEHHKWLEEKGYMLRPRYRPGWVPSWDVDDTTLFPYDLEDAIPCRVCSFSLPTPNFNINVV